MEFNGDKITIGGFDEEIDKVLKEAPRSHILGTHFSQSEEFFVKTAAKISVASLPIHHDYKIKNVLPKEKEVYLSVLEQAVPLLPGVFEGLRFFFDPTDNLKPGFLQILKLDEAYYVYLLRLDLGYKSNYATVLKRGGNDDTPSYETSTLFFEVDLIPLSEVKTLEGSLELRVKQSVSDTWIGETGRGYFVQGIWLDRELTRFFSRLFTPPGKKLYPYFPLNCKFRSICFQPLEFGTSPRKKSLAYLHEAKKILEPSMRNIEASLKSGSFSEDHPAFLELKQKLNERFYRFFDVYSVKTYLNDNELKEYELLIEKN